MHPSTVSLNTSQVGLLLCLLPLDLIHKVEVSLVEVMYTNVTILSTAAVSSSLWMDGNVVKRAEVAPHTANLLAEDLVVEPGFELSLSCAGGRDVHGGLTTSEDNIVLDGSDGSAIQRRIGDVGLEDFQTVGGKDLCGLVL